MKPHVALLIAMTTSHDRGILQGITAYIQSHAPWVILFDPWRALDDIPHIHSCQGVIAQIRSTKMRDSLQAIGLPTVNISSGSVLQDQFPMVLSDDAGTGRMVAIDFVNRGLEHFAYYGMPSRAFSNDIQHGFCQSINKFRRQNPRLRPPFIHWDDNHDATRGLTGWLKGLPKPIGLLACSDNMGRAAIEAAHLAEIEIPDELAVVGIDDDPQLCELAHPPLSSVRQASEQIGYRAAALLARMMGGKAAPRRPIRVAPLEIVTRRSSDILAINDGDIRNAVRFIRDHASQPLSVEHILREVPISRRTLELRFRQILGRSPREEIRRAQIERAKMLLATTAFAIPQVAVHSGFTNPMHFSTAFKREAGCTPSAYRGEYRRVP